MSDLLQAVREARQHCPAHFKHVPWFSRLGEELARADAAEENVSAFWARLEEDQRSGYFRRDLAAGTLPPCTS